MADTDFRFDPFRQVFRPVPISNEVHVAQYFDALGRVGFFTREACQRRSPSSVVVKDAALVTLSEVSRTTVPAYGNYRVDYSALTYWSHSFVEVHETRIGQTFTISYHGLGMGLNSSFRADDRFNLERSVTVQGGMTAESLRVLGETILRGSVLLALSTGSTISASGKRIKDVTESLSTDLVSLGKFLGLTRRTQPEILTGSGNWSRPANVSKVFFVLVGPGGDGHSAGGGGGGGGSVYGVADLDAIGGDMFAYVVGVVGIATTMFGCVAGAGNSATSGGSGGAGGTGTVGSTGINGVPHTGGNGANGYFIAVASDGTNRVMTSQNGIDWFSRTAAENNTWVSIAYGDGLIVSVASTGTNRVMTSPDGAVFTSRTAAENNTWFEVTYGNGLFVAVSADGANRTMSSPDGINWTAHLESEVNDWTSITYGAGLFVAVAQNGTNRVMTSPDGATWTSRSAASANGWQSITYGAGLFVAVAGTSGVSNNVMISTDGITWTSRTTPGTTGWLSVTYGGGLFVAVSAEGSARIMTSPDGATWTERTAPELNNWFSVTYGNGIYVAVSSTGTNRVMTSQNGIDWFSRSAAENNGWLDVRYIPGGGGGGSAGGFGGNGNHAENGKPGERNGFFSGRGGDAVTAPETFGGGAGANGTGSDGLILLIY